MINFLQSLRATSKTSGKKAILLHYAYSAAIKDMLFTAP